ncbi:two-component regulator propeller domain-containing protein [Pelagicoccus sp. SDUM812005]|uniref:two-component regulator propeller domain-containing protein n=1 Tax=Pelagicoccus sp. SDUM812005 TaxID=3041257 RepID=UPI00280C8FEF|nr:two-component regulator propeller domain-containing protein [Pelagicoccus sp. SDUM812005]MDQ8182657.1 two-component regulator propeller domain-containing protein [Pelagicoccus sp. SDUM812005]
MNCPKSSPSGFFAALFFVAIVGVALGQRDLTRLRFEALTERFESSGGEIHRIVEGPSGFIWFGTNRGALRYDGYEVHTYRNKAEEPTSLINDVVWSFLVDAQHRFWIGTQMGISRFVPEMDAFENYVLNPVDMNNNLNNRCNAIVQDSEGNVYASAESGILYRFDELENRFEPMNSASFGVIKSMACDELDRIWIGSNSAVYRFDAKTRETRAYVEGFQTEGGTKRNFIYSIDVSDPEKIWLGTAYQGVVVLDPKTGEARPLPVRHPNERRVHFLQAADEDRIWICHGRGLTLMRRNEQRIQDYMSSKRVDSLPSGSIRCLAMDRQSNVWVGSAKYGVHVSTNNKMFDRNYLEKAVERPGVTRVVSRVLWTKDGRLWLGYYNGGIDVFAPDGSHEFEFLHDPDDASSIGRGAVYSLMEDSRGEIWVGTFTAGLMRFDRERRVFLKYESDPDTEGAIPGGDPRAIAEDEEGNLWIALKGAGIAKYDRETGLFESYKSDPYNSKLSLLDDWPSDILYDPSGLVYVATPIGLSVLDTKTKRFTNYTPEEDDAFSLSNALCHTLYRDAAGKIWVGTGNGLNRFDPETKRFRSYTMKDGLPSHQALCVTQDRDGNIWVGMDSGLARIDLESDTIKSYGVLDGLMTNAFFRNSVARSPDGDIYFGQTGGLTFFDPAEIRENLIPPPVFITDVQVFFKSLKVDPQDPDSLQKHISELDELVLSHDQKVLSISFVAQNYIQPQKNQYAYFLEGFDSDWNEVGTRREANYTNLNPGSYVFRVKASNNDGVWNETGASLRLRILPPFWMTPWFFGLVALLVGLIVYSFIWYRERKLKLTQRLLEEKVQSRTKKINEQNLALEGQRSQLEKQRDELQESRELLEHKVQERTSELVKAKEKAEESDRLKSSFLANLSHEIRTPLNAVVGFSSLLKETKVSKEDVENYMGLIIENSDSLLRLIDDILDYSLIEANQVTAEESEFLWDEFINLVYASHSVLPREPGVELLCENALSGQGYAMVTDHQRLRQVLDNLLTNAAKFTNQGRIVLGARIEDESFCIFVKDTGKGILPEFQQAIFDQFYKLREDDVQARRGVGLGLAISKRLADMLGGSLSVESEYGKGATFSVRFPVSVLKRSQPRKLPEIHARELPEKLVKAQAGRILVIEDERNNFLLLEAILKPTRFEVLWADRGEDGVRMYREEGPFDLVLLDIKMPGIDGFETIKRLRAINQNVLVVAQTAYAMAEDKIRILEAGFSRYVSKPINAKELLRVLAELLPGD